MERNSGDGSGSGMTLLYDGSYSGRNDGKRKACPACTVHRERGREEGKRGRPAASTTQAAALELRSVCH